jgi:hypothetical protein
MHVFQLLLAMQMYGTGGYYRSMKNVVAAVQRFLDVSGASSLPNLKEYEIMLDKVYTPLTSHRP